MTSTGYGQAEGSMRSDFAGTSLFRGGVLAECMTAHMW